MRYCISYVKHCIRLYNKTHKRNLSAETDLKDWEAVQTVFQYMKLEDIAIVSDMAAKSGAISPSTIASKYNTDSDTVKDLFYNTVRQIAIQRGLYDPGRIKKT